MGAIPGSRFLVRKTADSGEKIGSSRKVGGANKDLGEAPKSCTRKEHESATNSIAKRGQGAIAPCRVKGQRPLWGLGQRPNSSTGDQYAKRAQQRRRQRSVPASNFALPQERPQAALSNIGAVSRQMGATDHPRCPHSSDSYHPHFPEFPNAEFLRKPLAFCRRV